MIELCGSCLPEGGRSLDRDYVVLYDVQASGACTAFLRVFKDGKPTDTTLDGVTAYSARGEVRTKCPEQSVEVDTAAMENLLGQVRDAVINNTTVLKAEIDEMQSAVTTAIGNVIATIDDGIEVTATQNGVWQVEVTNPTDLDALATKIATALDNLNVTIAGQAANLNVNVVNDKLVVTVDNFPTPIDYTTLLEEIRDKKDAEMLYTGRIVYDADGTPHSNLIEWTGMVTDKDGNATEVQKWIFNVSGNTVTPHTLTSGQYLDFPHSKDYEYVVLYDSREEGFERKLVKTITHTGKGTAPVYFTAVELTSFDYTQGLNFELADNPIVNGGMINTTYNDYDNTANYINIDSLLDDTGQSVSPILNPNNSKLNLSTYNPDAQWIFKGLNILPDGAEWTINIYGLAPISGICKPFIRRFKDNIPDGDFELDGVTPYTTQYTVTSSCSNSVSLKDIRRKLQTLIDKTTNATRYKEYTSSNGVEGTNIVVTFIEGTGTVSFGTDSFSLDASKHYRSEPMDGEVWVDANAGAKYHISWRA